MSARFENGHIVVLSPAHLSASAERVAAEDLVGKVVQKRGSARNDDALMATALRLSAQYVPGSPEPTSVRWVSNMTTRWASCSPAQGTIRLSDKLIGMPDYVIEAVVLHEVAHLVESGHGPGFQRIVRRYPKHDLADAYLAGASFAAARQGQLPHDGLDASSDEEGAPGHSSQ